MYSPYQMQLQQQMFGIGPGGTQQLIGPGGTQQPMIGPGGTQQLIGPGGTQPQPSYPSGPQSPYSEVTGYPTAPTSTPMIGPGGTQQLIGPGGTQQHLLGPGGTQQQPQQQQMNTNNPYMQFMQMLMSHVFGQQGSQQQGGFPNNTNNNLGPQNGLPQTLLSMMQNPAYMNQLQAMFGG